MQRRKQKPQRTRHGACSRRCSPPDYAAALKWKYPLKSLQSPCCKTKGRMKVHTFFPRHVTALTWLLQTAFSPAVIGAQTAGTDRKARLATVRVPVPSRTIQMFCLHVQQLGLTHTMPTDGTQKLLDHYVTHKFIQHSTYIAFVQCCVRS